MNDLLRVGADWVVEQADKLTDTVVHVSPVDFIEAHRYLPLSVTNMPGPFRFEVNPFAREIVECFDVDSPVREVNLLKGVQITYSTILECGLLYFMAHVKTLPIMYVTADNELSKGRVENNFLPMLAHAGFTHIIKSGDTGNARKTGLTAKLIQFEGGGYLIPQGAQNANKFRDKAIATMLEDEIDGWPQFLTRSSGDPVKECDDRCSGYWLRRKIFRGSTPLLMATSKIYKQYLRGDCRKYMVLCRACSYPQELRWEGVNKETGHEYGFAWDYNSEGMLDIESVRYRCQDCGHEHYEHDKQHLFATEHGAHWKPTKAPVQPHIRSYHLPGMYSPIGMQPWYKSVGTYLEAYDPIERKVRDIKTYQVFYNNVLGWPFKTRGSKIHFTMVSAHRRVEYRFGQVPNVHAIAHTGGHILFLTCTVDVHKEFLAVAVIGWTRYARSYLIEYFRLEDGSDTDDGCGRSDSPVWGQLGEWIEEHTWTADNGTVYKVALTFIDAGWQNETVVNFCAVYEAGVFPVLGRDRPSKFQKTTEFAPFETKSGTIGYLINVDYYKDRLAPVLRREWDSGDGEQRQHHFNAPVDITDKQLKELTVESKMEKVDERTGTVSYHWYRPQKARQELWDTVVYGHAAVEILMWDICVNQEEMEAVDPNYFWDLLERDKLFIQ